MAQKPAKLIIEEAHRRLREVGMEPYLDEYKDSYQEIWDQYFEYVKKSHEEKFSGKSTVILHTRLIDEHVEFAYKRLREKWLEDGLEELNDTCIIGLEEYGRRRVSPYGRVNLIIAYSDRVSQEGAKKLKEFYGPRIIKSLGILGCEMLHSILPAKEILRKASENWINYEALLTNRYVVGSEKLYQYLKKEFDGIGQRGGNEEFAKELIKQEQLRWQSRHNTVFLQEPNLQYGVGGIRDYYDLLVIAKVTEGAERTEDLYKKRFLTYEEADILERAYNCLLRIRNELQLRAKKPCYIIDLRTQPLIAPMLGYEQDSPIGRAKAFMHEYFENANKIHKMTRRVQKKLLKKKQEKKKSWFSSFMRACKEEPIKKIDGFLLKGNCFVHTSSKVFKEDPIRLVRIFRHQQQFNANLSPDLQRLIKESLDLITDGVVKSPGANKCLRSILQSTGNVYPPLIMMHKLGVLERLMPEFLALRGEINYKPGHIFTVDIHCLKGIKALDNVFSEKYPYLVHYDKAIRSTTRPTLLYLMILIHDFSEEEVDGVLKRLHINIKQKEIVKKVIKNRLILREVWEKEDTSDLRIISKLTTELDEIEVLQYVYVFTYCDIQGWNPSHWNDYKEMLNTKLYENALSFFEKWDTSSTERKERKKVIFGELYLEYKPEATSEEIEKMLHIYPERYFVSNTPEEMALHFELLKKLEERLESSDCSGTLMPIVHWQDDVDQGMTIVTIVTWDRSQLFANLSGAFSAVGLNIISTKAFTRTDKITIDTFFLVEVDDAQRDKQIQKKFETTLKNIVVNDVDPTPMILNRLKKQESKLSENELSMINSIDVHHDLSLNKTIIEIKCQDHFGLLFLIAKTISEHGFDITFAHIATEKNMVIDTFHLQKSNVDESTSAQDLISLRESLNGVMNRHELPAMR